MKYADCVTNLTVLNTMAARDYAPNAMEGEAEAPSRADLVRSKPFDIAVVYASDIFKVIV